MSLTSLVLPFPLNLIVGFLGKIPWQVWAILGVSVAFMLWLGAHDRALTKKVTAERDTYWQGREKEANDRYAAEMNRKRGEVADLVLKGIADRDALEKKLREQNAAAERKFTELENRRSAYVTPLADSRCIVPRGFVLQFNAGAAEANGAPEPHGSAAADPGADLVDAASGIPLSAVSRVATDTQAALGKCRTQVIGWQEHWANVLVWYASLTEILKGSP